MKKIVLISLLAASFSALAGSHAESGAHWGYSGEGAPENWAKLTPENHACTGVNQSPVNLTGFVEAQLAPLNMQYKAGGTEIINNGHTVQVNYQSGSQLVIEGDEYALLQAHFHAPSENNIEGKSYPLEAHLVHKSAKGNLAVVAVMFEVKGENAGFKTLWQSMPKHAGDKHALATAFNIEQLLPKNRDYYRFNGSLTTPPCSEGVRWFVMKESVAVSAEQVKAFSNALTEPNNRPVQPVNARLILK